MGSNQSSDIKNSFSIDANGNIIERRQPSSEQRAASSAAGFSNADNEHIVQANMSNQIESTGTAFDTENIDSSKTPDISLKEANAIATRMKAKFKPELMSKQQNFVQEIEQNIIQCYASNKNQTANCSELVRKYRNHINEQRGQSLGKSLAKNVPIITTIFVALTCLLLHVSTVNCYGAMSIDLGSEWMKVGLVAPSIQMDIVLNAQSQRKTPMAIAFSNGERFIGDAALDIASKYPERTFTHFLDLLGKQNIDHDSVRHYMSRFPYANISNPPAESESDESSTSTTTSTTTTTTTSTTTTTTVAPILSNASEASLDDNSTIITSTTTVPSDNSATTTAAPKIKPVRSIIMNHPEGLQFTPLELVAMMIQHAHDQVASILSSSESVADVVITVPPFFNSTERRMVQDAANLIGLNVLRLTSVNAAFALSYGIFRQKEFLPLSSGTATNVLFFDQGASHTSVSLASYHLSEPVEEVSGSSKNESLPTISIKAQVYDRYLGGFDMQLKLRDYLVNSFASANKIDADRIMKRGRSSSKLLKEAGRVKKILSANTGHTIRIENVIDDMDLRQPITRQEFEDLNEDYLNDRIVRLLDRLFEMPGIDRNENVESVIIVGGNTRTPRLQQKLLEYFKLETLGKTINADEGAALAALYQAASLSRGFRVKKYVLNEFRSSEDASIIDPSDPIEQTSLVDLANSNSKLALLRDQDNKRLYKLSLMNALESLLNEAREKKDNEKLQQVISETEAWLEDGRELNNMTMLIGKMTSIQELMVPKVTLPPPHVEL